MKSVLKLSLVAYQVKGYDRRDRSRTFEETVIVSDAGRKSSTFPQSLKDRYDNLGFELMSYSRISNELRDAEIDLQQLYDESTDRHEISKEY